VSASESFAVFPIEDSPGYRINRLARAMNLLLQRSFKGAGYDVTAPQWAVLSKLWDGDGVHQSELAEQTTRDRHSMARMLPVMESRGWVRRKADPSDRRLQRVYLTAEGRRLRRRLVPVAESAMAQMFDGIAMKDLACTLRVLRKAQINVEGAE